MTDIIHSDPLCSTTNFLTIPSPEGRHVAVSFGRCCPLALGARGEFVGLAITLFTAEEALEECSSRSLGGLNETVNFGVVDYLT